MRANSLENIIADQIFKISNSDKTISDYLIDCQYNDKSIKKSPSRERANL